MLELISFSLTVNNRNRERAFFINSSNFFSSFVYNNFYKISGYFNLKQENERLIKENISLKNSILKFSDSDNFFVKDQQSGKQYLYMYAEVVNNSVSNQINYITVNKGKKDGIVKDMAVVNSDGVVGIVTNVSRNYCVVLSVLNTLNSIGAKLKNTEYFGAVSWDAKDYRQVVLNGIPNHTDIKKGDTILTSGFSAIFPNNVMIGTVDTLWKNSQNNFYTIKVNLAADIKSLSNVYLIKNFNQKEQWELEEQTKELLE